MSGTTDLAAAFAEFNDNLAPAREWAMGYRMQLERDGWSMTQAERIAADALIEVSRSAFRQPANDGSPR